MIVIFVEFIDQLIDYPINHASLTAQTLKVGGSVHVVLAVGGGGVILFFLSTRSPLFLSFTY